MHGNFDAVDCALPFAKKPGCHGCERSWIASVAPSRGEFQVQDAEIKRIEFTLVADGREALNEPISVESCRDLPLAIMQAVEDYLEANNGELNLPLTIQVQPSRGASTC